MQNFNSDINMWKFLKHMLLFAVVVAAVLSVVGLLLDRARHMAGGATARVLCINDSMRSDVVIMGSSRALHHYDPAIMSRVLKTSVYNCGEDRMGIVFNYGRFCLFTRRYMPKVIVYDIEPDYDLLFDDNASYITELRPYVGDSRIRRLIADVGTGELFKSCIVPYWLNNRLQQVVKDCIVPDCYVCGYLPYTGVMEKLVPETLLQDRYDALKIKYLTALADECAGRSRLIFTASPQLSYCSDSVFVPLKKFCASRNIVFINHFCDTAFTRHHELFHNANHHEKRGAERYSKLITSEIRDVLRRENAIK